MRRDEGVSSTVFLAKVTCGDLRSTPLVDPVSQAVQSLPEDEFNFALNAAHDTLPHNANLHNWHKKTTRYAFSVKRM